MRIISLIHQLIRLIISVILLVSLNYGQENITKMRISVIQVSTEDEATEIIELLENGAEFSELAKQYSIGPNKKQGGDFGYFAPGEMEKRWDDTVLKLKVGDFSHPIKTGAGYFIVMKTEEKSVPPEEEGVRNKPPIFYALSEKPQVIKRVNPQYPMSAIKAGLEGVVVVKVLVGLKGDVEKVEVLKSVPGLDEAAIKAAKYFCTEVCKST